MSSSAAVDVPSQNNKHLSFVDAAVDVPSQNNKHLSFVDEAWLHAFGLSESNALDYFALSMFYDYRSNNQAIRTQGASASQLLSMTGLEFALEVPPQLPQVYVIRKQIRKSPRLTDVIEVYYIINGVIYQSPSLMDVASTRIMKAVLYLDNAFSVLTAQHSYSNETGHVAFTPSAAESAQVNAAKAELISRELPSLQSTIDDIYTFCQKS